MAVENALTGSNHVFKDEISNSDQAAAAVAAKFFFISEDRLKVLALLARQVCQMCQEVYEVEIKSSGTAAHVHWSCPSGHSSDFCTQDTMNNVHVGDMKASAAVSSLASHLGLRLGDVTTLCTIQDEHCYPVLEETLENVPNTNVADHNKEGDDLLDPADDVSFSNAEHTQQEVMDSESAVKVEDDMSNAHSQWQMPQIKTEYETDADPCSNICITNVVHVRTQREMMNLASPMTTDGISNEGPELQMGVVKKVYNTTTGNNVGSSFTLVDPKPTDREPVPSLKAVVRKHTGQDSHESWESDNSIIHQNEEIQGTPCNENSSTPLPTLNQHADHAPPSSELDARCNRASKESAYVSRLRSRHNSPLSLPPAHPVASPPTHPVPELATSSPSSRPDSPMDQESAQPVPTSPLSSAKGDVLGAEKIMKRNNELEAEVHLLRQENNQLRSTMETEWTKGEPGIVPVDDTNVLIGRNINTHIMVETDYMDCFFKAKDPKGFVLRLIGKVFSEEELASSNFYGGEVKSGKHKVRKNRLSTNRAFKAILAQAEIAFPGSVSSGKFQNDIRPAINSRCRRAAFNLRKCGTHFIELSCNR